MIKKIAIIILVLINTQTFSQTLSTKSKKAKNYFNKALTAYNAYNYDKAIYWSEAALKKDEEFIEVYYLLSDIYGELKQPTLKILNLKKAIILKPEKSTLAYFTLIKTELSIGKYKDAKRHIIALEKYDKLKKYASRTKLLKKIANFGINAMQNPVNFKPINLGENINSEYNE